MGKVKISQIATELGYSAKDIIAKAAEMGLENIKSPLNTVSEEEAHAIYTYVQSGDNILKKNKKTTNEKVAKEKKDPNLINKKAKIEEVKSEKAKTTTKEAPKEKSEKKVEEVSSEKVEESPKESLALNSLKKRRGLIIVKKKDLADKEIPAEKKVEKAATLINKDLSSIFANAEANLKKRKKEKKAPAVKSKKDEIKKIDLGEISFGDTKIDSDEDVVILPDLTVKPIEVEKKASSKQPTFLKQNHKTNFTFDNNVSRGSRKKKKKILKNKEDILVDSVNIPKDIRLYEFADKIGKTPGEVIGKLFALGLLLTKNDFLDEDAIEILGEEFGIAINIQDEAKDFDYVKIYDEEADKEDDNLVEKAPVITIMGHVDHGKTSLLDYIRNSRVAVKEAGGITQHVGAYMVEKNGRKITFLDTPGHEAFSAMRARGAKVTDIVIIVVAADDGVKPQTKEAIEHAKAANVPIIIAINKMDKEQANPENVKAQLADLGILPTEWGGTYEFVPISAKTGAGVDELLEIVLLQADILELKANPTAKAKAMIVEGTLLKGRGPVATVVVQNGTLKIGDTVVAGVAYGKVRDIYDDASKKLKEIAPGECGVIVGLSEVPQAGETLIAVKNDKEAREYANKIYEHLRQKELSKSTKVTLDELSAKIAEGELKSLPIILKADVQGSLEALKATLNGLRNEEIKVDIISSGVGGITQNDISLASSSENCVILGFNIRPTGEIKDKAKEAGVEIKTYNVIYNLIDDVKALLSGMMSPIIREEALGQAVVRQVITVPKIGQIAGCLVTDGSIIRGAKIRVIREGIIIFQGNISSLKRFKDDVKEVTKGFECGVGIEGYNDMRENDYIESYKEVEEQASL